MLENGSEYLQVLDKVKREIVQTRARTVSHVNSELICMYWRIGFLLDERSFWGSKAINTLSHDIRSAFPGIKGFSVRYLKYMMKFARETEWEFVQTAFAQISWSHNIELMNKVKKTEVRLWYALSSIENGWSRAVLVHQIESHLYERQALSGTVNNFARTLPESESELAQQALKDPFIFDFITAQQSRNERDIEMQMVENVTKVLLELGTGFAFMGNQYHLTVGGEDFYIDLLFYNVRLHCYLVVELKNEKFKPEFTGKLGFYVTVVDDMLADAFDNPTIGLVLCKEKNDVVAEYALRSVDQPVGISAYRLGDELPDDYKDVLPSPEDLQTRI